ncbi:putative L,D-transpeptidase YnhG precursor [bacterium BMS3Abin08]|nr:putative L,D-transpeptidase YnhG precursor [bacterium BMS3Abin08]
MKLLSIPAISLSLLLSLLLPLKAYSFSGAYFIKDNNELFGLNKKYIIKHDKETLIDLSLRYDLGYNEITDANPEIDPWFPGKDREITLPTSWILPSFHDDLSDGDKLIIINLAEMRLYLIKKLNNKMRVTTFPVGIGRAGGETPLGSFRVNEKLKNPAWTIPPSIRDEYPDLPDIVPPGPENPLGRYALRLSRPEYLIHGTNKPLGIGRQVSHGCIRMYPEDIVSLFRLVSVRNRVLIVYQPVKIGAIDGEVYIEVHRDYRGKKKILQDAITLLRKRGLLDKVDDKLLYRAVNANGGYPVRISTQSLKGFRIRKTK